MSQFLISLATLTRSTGKPGDLDSSKHSGSMARTETVADGRGELEPSGNGQGMWMLDEMSNTVDQTRPGNDYAVPSPYEEPFPLTTTAFAEDICVVQDDEPVYANIQ